MKQLKIVKVASHSFQKPQITSSSDLFCPTNSTKHKNVQFLIIENTEKHKTHQKQEARTNKYLVCGNNPVENVF